MIWRYRPRGPHARDSRAASADQIARLKQAHRAWFLRMSPAARAAYRAFREAEAANPLAWTRSPDAEAQLTLAEAEYEAWFGEGKDRRAHNDKLIDMRVWTHAPAPASDGEDGA